MLEIMMALVIQGAPSAEYSPNAARQQGFDYQQRLSEAWRARQTQPPNAEPSRGHGPTARDAQAARASAMRKYRDGDCEAALIEAVISVRDQAFSETIAEARAEARGEPWLAAPIAAP